MCSERLQPRAQSEEDPAAGLIQSYFVVGLRVSSLHVSTWEEQQTVLLADRHGLEFQTICSLEQITKLTRVPVSSSAKWGCLNRSTNSGQTTTATKIRHLDAPRNSLLFILIPVSSLARTVTS